MSVIMLNVIMLNVIMLNVIMLNVIMLNVIMLNVIMLPVMAPFKSCKSTEVQVLTLYLMFKGSNIAAVGTGKENIEEK